MGSQQCCAVENENKATQSHREFFEPLGFTIALKMPANPLKLAQPIKINGTQDGLLSRMISLPERTATLSVFLSHP
jgi:hypothetical protein